MFVWQWVQQHRVLSVLVLAAVIVSCAGGTAWALVFRTVSSPVGPARGAAHLPARADGQGAGLAARPAARARCLHRTAPAAARASACSVSHRSFPPTTSMIVADGSCATVSWVPITQHTEATTVCARTDGAFDHAEAGDGRVHRRIHHHLDDRLPGGGLPAAAGGPPGPALGRHLLAAEPGGEGGHDGPGARAGDHGRRRARRLRRAHAGSA